MSMSPRTRRAKGLAIKAAAATHWDLDQTGTRLADQRSLQVTPCR
jgi:hypothetical protein